MIQFNEYLEIGTKQISYKYKKDTPGEQTTMKREKFIPKNVMDEDVPAFMGCARLCTHLHTCTCRPTPALEASTNMSSSSSTYRF